MTPLILKKSVWFISKTEEKHSNRSIIFKIDFLTDEFVIDLLLPTLTHVD